MKVFSIISALVAAATSTHASPLDQHSFSLSVSPSLSANHSLIVGSYGGSPLTVFSFNPSTLALSNLSTVPSAGSGASWATLDSSKNFVYTVNDHADSSAGKHSIHAYSFQNETRFKTLNVQKSGGDGTVMVHRSRGSAQCLYAANYGGASMSVLKLSQDGSIDLSKKVFNFAFQGNGPVKDRQSHSYPHEAIDSPDGKFIYVPDLGADRIHSFSLTKPSNCTLTQLPSIKTDAGDGPRHMEFYKDVITRQTYAYVVTELSGVVRTYLVQDSGILKLLKVQSTRPAFTGSDLTGIQPSEVIISPDGRFAYVALRHLPHTGPNKSPGDSVAIFSRSIMDGTLTGPTSFYHTGGRNPRHFSISKDVLGSFIAVANQGDDDQGGKGSRLTMLKRDPIGGGLELLEGAEVEIKGTSFAGFV